MRIDKIFRFLSITIGKNKIIISIAEKNLSSLSLFISSIRLIFQLQFFYFIWKIGMSLFIISP